MGGCGADTGGSMFCGRYYCVAPCKRDREEDDGAVPAKRSRVDEWVTKELAPCPCDPPFTVTVGKEEAMQFKVLEAMGASYDQQGDMDTAELSMQVWWRTDKDPVSVEFDPLHKESSDEEEIKSVLNKDLRIEEIADLDSCDEVARFGVKILSVQTVEHVVPTGIEGWKAGLDMAVLHLNLWRE